MDRRDFLKILGIGGVALTLPKPLGIIAAKMADLQAPPLHIGYCEIGPLCNDERTFLWDRMSVGVDRTLSLDRHTDWAERWLFTMFFRRKQDDPSSRVMWMKTRASHLPDPQKKIKTWVDDETDENCERKVQVEVPHEYRMPKQYMWSPNEVAEFWFTPAPGSDLPRFPLPKLTVFLHGVMLYKKEAPVTGRDYVLGSRSMTYTAYYGAVNTVQLDRARAIEMGLVTPQEPEGIIV